MPQPPKFTPDITAKILEEFAKVNCTEKRACAYAGVHDRTLRKWLEQGGKDLEAGVDSEFSRFWLAFERVRGDRVASLIDTALDSEEASPAAGARWLAPHLDPLSFSTTTKHEVSGPEGGPLQHEHRHNLDPDALCDRITALAARLACGTAASPSDAGAGRDDGG